MLSPHFERDEFRYWLLKTLFYESAQNRELARVPDGGAREAERRVRVGHLQRLPVCRWARQFRHHVVT